MAVAITKASGETEPFIREKLQQSLVRAGAPNMLATKIVEDIENTLTQGMSTKAIYKRAHKLLIQLSKPSAGRYHLKNGIMELGPSGFPFEAYLSKILHEMGFAVKTGQMVEGKCVKHEVDVIAEKDNNHFMIECKYHNSPGMVCDVKIPLYIHSRFRDVEAQWMQLSGHGTKFHQGWVVTNTRFTSDAIAYGTCAGLNLISLDFPKKGSLREMIEDTGLYPLTCLSSLSREERRILLEKKIVLCRDICYKPDLLRELNIPEKRIEIVLQEGHQLCHKLVQHGHH